MSISNFFFFKWNDILGLIDGCRQSDNDKKNLKLIIAQSRYISSSL